MFLFNPKSNAVLTIHSRTFGVHILAFFPIKKLSECLEVLYPYLLALFIFVHIEMKGLEKMLHIDAFSCFENQSSLSLHAKQNKIKRASCCWCKQFQMPSNLVWFVMLVSLFWLETSIFQSKREDLWEGKNCWLANCQEQHGLWLPTFAFIECLVKNKALLGGKNCWLLSCQEQLGLGLPRIASVDCLVKNKALWWGKNCWHQTVKKGLDCGCQELLPLNAWSRSAAFEIFKNRVAKNAWVWAGKNGGLAGLCKNQFLCPDRLSSWRK